MSFDTKQILRDVNGFPIPQFWDGSNYVPWDGSLTGGFVLLDFITAVVLEAGADDSALTLSVSSARIAVAVNALVSAPFRVQCHWRFPDVTGRITTVGIRETIFDGKEHGRRSRYNSGQLDTKTENLRINVKNDSDAQNTYDIVVWGAN